MRQLLKFCLSEAVSAWATLSNFSFPSKYTWRWKLDMLTGRYELETTRLFKHIVKPGMIVIDIGAHIGYFSRLAAKRVGKKGHIYAFESDPENRSLLMKNVARYPWVHIRDEAVSDIDGPIIFYHLKRSTGCHTTIPTDERSEQFTVPATRLDTFFEKNRIQRVDLIKIDIEGGEIRALKGMLGVLRKKPRLIIEYNPSALARSGASDEALFELLQQYGYSISAITSKGLIPLKSPFSISAGALLGPDNSVNMFCEPV